MSSDSSTQSQKPVFLTNTQAEQPPTLPCPRCDSINTKFCYYNNYNLSQPRHFCKSCRRYWTQGGTLRNIPVGGGTRKNSSSSSSKRLRTTTKTTTSSDTSSVTMDHPISATPVSTITPKLETDQFLPLGYNVDLNAVNGGFTSLLHSRGGAGYLALGGTGGFGLGIGSGFEELGLGFGVWPEIGEGGGHAVSGGANSGATWQIGSGCDGGFADTECYAWPELAISTPRKEVK